LNFVEQGVSLFDGFHIDGALGIATGGLHNPSNFVDFATQSSRSNKAGKFTGRKNEISKD
jgi:hypothetical protein